jgi:hypothetical protein
MAIIQSKSILLWGLATLALVGSVVLSVSLFKSEQPIDQKSAQAHAKPTKSNVAAHKSNGGTKAQVPVSQANHPSLLSKQEEALAFLHDTSVTYDPAELPKIQPYLLSSDKEVQMAAINAMVVLGDAGASPMLREASRQITDTDVVMEMLKAADYLELPPVDLKKMASFLKSSAANGNQSSSNNKQSGRAAMIAKERQNRIKMQAPKLESQSENSH